MFKGKTSSGFTYEANERTINDWRFLQTLTEADDSSNPMQQIRAIRALLRMIIGTDGEIALTRHVEKDGIADQADVMRELAEIIQELRDRNVKAKNS